MKKKLMMIVPALVLLTTGVAAGKPLTLGYEYDITREKVPTAATLRRVADIVSSLGYTQLQLYFKDNFAYPAHPVIWKDRAHVTPEEMREFDAYCAERGLELVPYQSSFGHLEPWFRHAEYLPLAESPDGVHFTRPFKLDREPMGLCATSSNAVEFVAGLYDVLLPCFRGRYVNAGCDEVWDLYSEKCRSDYELREKGRGRVYVDFIRTLDRLARDRGKTLMFWSDIIHRYPDVVPLIPESAIALNWAYEADEPYAQTTAELARAKRRFYVCPGTSSWCSYFGRHDNMKGNVLNAFTNGKKNGAEGLLLTDWGDQGYPQPWIVSLPALVFTSALVRDGVTIDDAEIARRVDRVCGCRIGESLIRAANVYLKVPVNGGNGTSLYRFARHPEGILGKPWFKQADFDASVAELRAAQAMRDLTGAPAWVREDVELFDLLVDFVARRVGGARGSLSDEFRDRYVRIWNLQNRPEGVEESIRRVFSDCTEH